MPNFEEFRAGYRTDWERMKVDADRVADVDRAARRILAVKARYQTVSAATGVPWFLIGLLHMREADLSFSTHLHNGDSLKRRTVHVPAGRPKSPEPPYSWEESAIDALRYDHLDKVESWTLERIAFQAEGYNGFGPRNRGKASGYLWAGSDIYTGGKFVADRDWDPRYFDRQLGIMPILMRLSALDAEVAAHLEHPIAAAVRRPITIEDAKASAPVVQAVAKAAYVAGPVGGAGAATHSGLLAAVVIVAAIAAAVVTTIIVRRRHDRLVAVASEV